MTQRIETPKVVLCTGSVPMEIKLPHYTDGIETIDIATVLGRRKPISRLPLDRNHVVAVVESMSDVSTHTNRYIHLSPYDQCAKRLLLPPESDALESRSL